MRMQLTPRCARCGRELVDEESRRRGLGPRCYERELDRLRDVARNLENAPEHVVRRVLEAEIVEPAELLERRPDLAHLVEGRHG